MKTLNGLLILAFALPHFAFAETAVRSHKPSDVRVKAEVNRLALAQLESIGKSSQLAGKPELQAEYDAAYKELNDLFQRDGNLADFQAKLAAVTKIADRIGVSTDASAKAVEAALAAGRTETAASQVLSFKAAVEAKQPKTQLEKDIASLPAELRKNILYGINERIQSKQMDSGFAQAQQKALLNAIRVSRSKTISAEDKAAYLTSMGLNFKHGVDESRVRTVEEMATAKDPHTLKVTVGFESIHDKVFEELMATKYNGDITKRKEARQEAAELVAAYMGEAVGKDMEMVHRIVTEIFGKDGIEIRKNKAIYCQMEAAGCFGKNGSARAKACAA